MYDVSISLICTRKSGTLSRFIRDLKLFGLQYQSHSIDYQGDNSLIVINASGELNCTQERLAELFGDFKEVIKVESVNVTRDGVEIKVFKTAVSHAHIEAQEPLSPAILLAAEKRLSDIVGPIATLLVETASLSSQTAGELYLLLAEELGDQAERKEFLSIIEHIEYQG